jgi:hypothetical protein
LVKYANLNVRKSSKFKVKVELGKFDVCSGGYDVLTTSPLIFNCITDFRVSLTCDSCDKEYIQYALVFFALVLLEFYVVCASDYMFNLFRSLSILVTFIL